MRSDEIINSKPNNLIDRQLKNEAWVKNPGITFFWASKAGVCDDFPPKFKNK